MINLKLIINIKVINKNMENTYSYCRIRTNNTNLRSCEYYTTSRVKLSEIIKFSYF